MQSPSTLSKMPVRILTCCSCVFVNIAIALPLVVSSALAGSSSPSESTIQREAQLFDLQPNSLSKVEISSTNYGIMGNIPDSSRGATFWPRNSGNQYLFGAGIWFGAQKFVDGESQPRKLVSMSYNPDSGESWCVPGRIEDGDEINESSAFIARNRLYISTDYDAQGQPFLPEDEPNWPLWSRGGAEQSIIKQLFGSYVHRALERTPAVQPGGPARISDEDMVCFFKDTDLLAYEGLEPQLRAEGYPLGLQYEQAIYSWSSEQFDDVLIVRYSVTNMSPDTLYDCWMAPILDFDLAVSNNARNGAVNDVLRFYDEDPELNLVLQWTEGNAGEHGRGFGYAGVSLLESPAVDANDFLRPDNRRYAPEEQLGLKLFRNWELDDDPNTSTERYDLISKQGFDEPSQSGDKRIVISTGPFTFAPGETATLAYAMAFAKSATQQGDFNIPTGTTEDAANIAALVRDTRNFYYERLASSVGKTTEASTIRRIGIYPTPASREATISFDAAREGIAHIEIITLIGQRAAPIQRVFITEGRNTFPVDATRLAPGLYLCQVTLSGSTSVATLIVAR